MGHTAFRRKTATMLYDPFAFYGKKELHKERVFTRFICGFFAGGRNICLNEIWIIGRAKECVLFHQFMKRNCS